VTPEPVWDARLRLFCFPYAGGGASAFFSWQRSLPRGVEVRGVQPPGREGRVRERPIAEWGPFLDGLMAELVPRLDVPFAFFGHSLGATVAFEVARRLRAMGGPQPLHLFASGRTAPHLPMEDPPVHALPEPEFVAELRRLGGTPEEVLGNADLMSILLPLLRADFGLSETYEHTPGDPLDLPITGYGGVRDERVEPERVSAWRQHTRAGFREVMFPGGHFFLHEDRQSLLADLSNELDGMLVRVR
jgi:medium-chain acyl-[acyl-carrier-protein] hydrolase